MKITIYLWTVLVLIFISSCTQVTEIEEKTGTIDVKRGGVDFLPEIPDLPLENIPPVLTVKEVIEHRSALREKIFIVRGYIIDAIPPEKACPSSGLREGCGIPFIKLADSMDQDRKRYYEFLTVRFYKDEDTKNFDYKEGQLVEIEVKLNVGPLTQKVNLPVYVNKI